MEGTPRERWLARVGVAALGLVGLATANLGCSGKSSPVSAEGGAGAQGTGGAAATDAHVDAQGMGDAAGCPLTRVLCDGYCLDVGQSSGGCTVLMINEFPTRIAMTATHVYYDDLLAGTISRVPVGGGAPQMVVTNGNVIDSLTVDATAVYFTTSLGGSRTSLTNGTVWSVPLAGGTARLLTDLGGLNAGELVVDPTNVYWLSQSSSSSAAQPVLHRVPLAGGTPTDLGLGRSPGAIAVDDTSVFWVDSDGGIRKAPKIEGATGGAGADGGLGTGDVLAMGNDPQIALDGGQVYFTDGLIGGLYSVAQSGGAKQTLNGDTLNSNAPVADATDVYFGTLYGEILRYHKAGGDTTTIARVANRAIGQILVDASSLYVLTAPFNASSGGSGIVRIAKP